MGILMIKSMTGFGRSELLQNDRKFSVEIRAVNHRYLDLSIRMPKKLGMLESRIRTVLKEYMERGKVDVFIGYEDYTGGDAALKYNEALAGEYLTHLRDMSEKFDLEYDIRVSTLARFPDIFVMEDREIDEEVLFHQMEPALRKAAENFAAARQSEGKHLKTDLLAKLSLMEGYVAEIEKRAPEIIEEYKASLREKIADLLKDSSVDDARFAAEVTIFADKVCVDEETVRLKSHVEAMKKELLSGGAIGRKLDFIAQEMNREANTILSKSTDLSVSDTGINLKTEIEKIREQVQNIE